MDVILATASTLPRPDEDDAPLRAALAQRGLSAQTCAWDDPAVDWAQGRVCVIRSTWNYVRSYARFLAWVESCAAVTRLWNPAAIVRWNSHKRYLLDLEQAGLPVVPTRLVPANGAGDLVQFAGDWDAVVIKPAVSAGSFSTVRVARADFATTGQAHVDALLAGAHDVLVQPFLRSVESYGERARWSGSTARSRTPCARARASPAIRSASPRRSRSCPTRRRSPSRSSPRSCASPCCTRASIWRATSAGGRA